MRTYVIIPARKASTRLPNKMLLRETGKTLLQHTYDAARAARTPSEVIVATDHADIAREVRQFGGIVRLTSPACASGTDRVAEVARELSNADIIVNVQGDEPEIDPDAIDSVVELLDKNSTSPMATLATPLRDAERINDPACVKVVFDDAGQALYFSRSPIPFIRDADFEADESIHYQHIGIYAFRRDFLLRLAAAPPSMLEQVEKLEQLRVLQMGEEIRVQVVDHAAQGIDTPTDYAAFVSRYLRRAG